MHERSEKHKKNVERKLKDIRHKEANEKKESDKLQKEMAEIEAKAAEAYAADLAAAGRLSEAAALMPNSLTPAARAREQEANAKRELETAIERELHAREEAEYRATQVLGATKDETTEEARKSYEFKHYILVSTLFEEDGEEEAEPAAGKKRKKGQPTRQKIFPRLEEEILLEHSTNSFFWRGKQNEENDIADFLPHRCCMVVEARVIDAFRKDVKDLFQDFK